MMLVTKKSQFVPNKISVNEMGAWFIGGMYNGLGVLSAVQMLFIYDMTATI